jgi:hypothetical protein
MRFCGSDDDVLVEGMGNRDYTAVSRQRRPKYLEWLRYVPGEVFHGVNVTASGAGRVVATEFVYHHLAEMGHGEPPCDPNAISATTLLGGHAATSAA